MQVCRRCKLCCFVTERVHASACGYNRNAVISSLSVCISDRFRLRFDDEDGPPPTLHIPWRDKKLHAICDLHFVQVRNALALSLIFVFLRPMSLDPMIFAIAGYPESDVSTAQAKLCECWLVRRYRILEHGTSRMPWKLRCMAQFAIVHPSLLLAQPFGQ